MRQALAISEPDLATEVGTPTRKIIDAVAEVVAEGYVDHYLLNYQYDIDSKVGDELDDFVTLFGFNRLPAKRATGSVTFSRTTPAPRNLLIRAGTQIASGGTPPVIFMTIIPAIIGQGENSVTIPCQAVIGGMAGNVAAGQITRAVNAIEGITNIGNLVAFTGGADFETDAQLRTRFKRTVFRSLAGTEQMFLGLALEDVDVSLANVIGTTKIHRETLELTGSPAAATSLIQDAKYIYQNSEAFGPDIDAGEILTPGVHYSFNNANPPTVTSLDAVVVPPGIYQLEYEYVPNASRNDPPNGITNRVDIYVNGERPTEASESLRFTRLKPFDNTAGSPYRRTNFQRQDGSNPVAGNYFQRFAFAPVLDASLGGEIVIGGITYVEDVDFFLVNDVTNQGGTFKSLSGIEWLSAANGATKAVPAEGTPFTNEYVFNAVPRDVEINMRQWRLITTDARVHQAQRIRLRLHLAVIYQTGFSESVVRPEIEAALRNAINLAGFDSVIQVSDLLAAVHGATGVDAVRFLTSADNAVNYAIQRVSEAGTVLRTYQTGGRADEVFTDDNEIAVFDSVVLVSKAENTFGVV